MNKAEVYEDEILLEILETWLYGSKNIKVIKRCISYYYNLFQEKAAKKMLEFNNRRES